MDNELHITRLYVPSIGQVLTLAADWTFSLFRESRNFTFAGKLGIKYGPWDWSNRKENTLVTLAAGTRLTVDRIYIKKGFKDFDSLTFWCNSHLTAAEAKREGRPKGRFWAKLVDVNQMIIQRES